MAIHSPLLSTDSVFCACGKKRKKKDLVAIKMTITKEMPTHQQTHF
jgi:hypothetical protein